MPRLSATSRVVRRRLFWSDNFARAAPRSSKDDVEAMVDDLVRISPCFAHLSPAGILQNVNRTWTVSSPCNWHMLVAQARCLHLPRIRILRVPSPVPMLAVPKVRWVESRPDSDFCQSLKEGDCQK